MLDLPTEGNPLPGVTIPIQRSFKPVLYPKIQIHAGQTTTINLTLAANEDATAAGPQTGRTCGTVQLPDGEPLPGVVVTADGKDSGQRTTVTNETERYCLRGLPPATYDVEAQMTDLQTKTEKATVHLGQTTELALVLEPAAIENVRVGGPYTITPALDGFRTGSVKTIFVKLGENREVDFTQGLRTIS